MVHHKALTGVEFISIAISLAVSYGFIKITNKILAIIFNYINPKIDTIVQNNFRNKFSAEFEAGLLCSIRESIIDPIMIFIVVLYLVVFLFSYAFFTDIGNLIHNSSQMALPSLEQLHTIYDDLKFPIYMSLVILAISLIVVIIRMIYNYRQIKKKIKFYNNEKSSHKFVYAILNAPSLSFKATLDALDKKSQGLISEADFKSIKDKFLVSPDSEFISYKEKSFNDTKLNEGEFVYAFYLKTSGLLTDTEFNIIKINFMQNTQLSLFDFNRLVIAVDMANEDNSGIVLLTENEMALKRAHFMNTLNYRAEKGVNPYSYLKEMRQNNVISDEEYKIKKHQMIKDNIQEVWGLAKIIICAGVIVACGILAIYCYQTYY